MGANGEQINRAKPVRGNMYCVYLPPLLRHLNPHHQPPIGFSADRTIPPGRTSFWSRSRCGEWRWTRLDGGVSADFRSSDIGARARGVALVAPSYGVRPRMNQGGGQADQRRALHFNPARQTLRDTAPVGGLHMRRLIFLVTVIGLAQLANADEAAKFRVLDLKPYCNQKRGDNMESNFDGNNLAKL